MHGNADGLSGKYTLNTPSTLKNDVKGWMNINISRCVAASQSLNKSISNPRHYLCSKPLKLMQITCAKEKKMDELKWSNFAWKTNIKVNFRLYSIRLKTILRCRRKMVFLAIQHFFENAFGFFVVVVLFKYFRCIHSMAQHTQTE